MSQQAPENSPPRHNRRHPSNQLSTTATTPLSTSLFSTHPAPALLSTGVETRTVKMLFFGSFLYSTPPARDAHGRPMLTTLFAVAVLLINSVAVLSEDRFLARSTTPYQKTHPDSSSSVATDRVPCRLVNLSPASYDPAFGAGPDASIKAKIINLIASVRTIMRSTRRAPVPPSFCIQLWGKIDTDTVPPVRF